MEISVATRQIFAPSTCSVDSDALLKSYLSSHLSRENFFKLYPMLSLNVVYVSVLPIRLMSCCCMVVLDRHANVFLILLTVNTTSAFNCRVNLLENGWLNVCPNITCKNVCVSVSITILVLVLACFPVLAFICACCLLSTNYALVNKNTWV